MSSHRGHRLFHVSCAKSFNPQFAVEPKTIENILISFRCGKIHVCVCVSLKCVSGSHMNQYYKARIFVAAAVAVVVVVFCFKS